MSLRKCQIAAMIMPLVLLGAPVGLAQVAETQSLPEQESSNQMGNSQVQDSSEQESLEETIVQRPSQNPVSNPANPSKPNTQGQKKPTRLDQSSEGLRPRPVPGLW